jgi:hypothetical protein
MQALWKLSLLLACFGCFTTVSTGMAALLGTYLLGLPHNFGQTYHFDAIRHRVLDSRFLARGRRVVDRRRPRRTDPDHSPPRVSASITGRSS